MLFTKKRKIVKSYEDYEVIIRKVQFLLFVKTFLYRLRILICLS